MKKTYMPTHTQIQAAKDGTYLAALCINTPTHACLACGGACTPEGATSWCYCDCHPPEPGYEEEATP